MANTVWGIHTMNDNLFLNNNVIAIGWKALFVTLSNYTKNSQKYLESTPIIRGINGTELVELILKYYDKMSEKYRKMIPLKMVYIPVAKEDAE